MALDDETPELELRDYLRVLRRRKWTIGLSALIVLSTALGSSVLQTSVYRATAKLLLQPRSTESLFDPGTGQRNDPSRAIQTEIQVLRSEPVQAAVKKALGVAPPVSVSPVGQTDVIELRSDSTNPQRAAVVANTYARSYIDFRRRQAVDDLLAAGQEVQEKITGLQAQIDAITNQLNNLDPKAGPDARRRLQDQADQFVSQQALFRQKLDELQVDAALKTGGAQLVTPAAVPSTPSEPRPKRTGAVALVVGLIFGVMMAFLFEYLDDSIKSKEALEAISGNLPVLGLIPAVSNWKDTEESRVISRDEPMSPAAEAYRSLRTSVQFLGLDRPVQALLLTSANAAEGKTTTLSNLAIALARAGQEVIVVCCDLRRPRLHQFFGLSNSVGFTSVLLGDVPLSAALQRVKDEDRLRVLASGPLPPNPSELLSSPRSAELFAALRRQADVVLIDASPVLPVTDAAVLSAQVDATLLVVSANSTTRKQAARAIELLRQVDAHLVGTVFNGVREEGAYGYAYQYYKRDDPPVRRRGRESVKSADKAPVKSA
ncbi:MAG: tyrosine-protein kinase [Acidimicrobiaceae bacterium]|jgi:capsular exopolysaccharide synthesis family protein|nr:tyrosine-protein kinase [Acidimicrobiaceae bacterium]MDQ1443609.1 tyrosine-protein kinase [Acidimicrobiaceae bacterium]